MKSKKIGFTCKHCKNDNFMDKLEFKSSKDFNNGNKLNENSAEIALGCVWCNKLSHFEIKTRLIEKGE